MLKKITKKWELLSRSDPRKAGVVGVRQLVMGSRVWW